MTSLLDRYGRELVQSARKASYGDGWLTAYQQGGINLSSLNIEPQEKAAKLLGAYKVGWFNKAERKISTDFSSLAVTLAPEDKAGDNQEDAIESDLLTPWASLDPIEKFLRLMEKPNATRQTGRQLRQQTMIWLDMAGWGWWYAERDEDGLVAENGLYGISPTRLWPSYSKTTGDLIGYVLDKNKPSGPTMTFEPDEIIPFTYGSADGDGYGVGVVEAIWSQTPLTDQMARHTADLLATGGRIAGMAWPKDRRLDDAEFLDAQRAWRSVVSDPNAARRLLLFPEPMEYSQGASTPAEIGIPELAALNRDEILTAFPISPYMLGTPFAGGLNESGASRREEKATYWEETIHPRVELFEETIQTYLVPRYEEVVGYTLDFEVDEPNLDDAETLVAKAEALDKLIAAGFNDKESVAAVGLEHIKWTKPKPVPVVVAPPEAPNPPTQPPPTKAARAVEDRDHVVDRQTSLAMDRLTRFLDAQKARVTLAWRNLPPTKAARTKAETSWWDAERENDELRTTMRGIYVEVGRNGLQAVSDTLGRVIGKGFVQNVLGDLLEYGGERIKDINARTLQALTIQLAEGTRRGYSIPQLVDGVPEEGYTGIAGVTLDNGTLAFDPYRAEMIARTETALSYNRATVTGYGEFGVTTLLAYDGDQDEECAARNGNEFSIAEARDIEDHPNGTLVWSPVVDKAYHDPLVGLTEKFLDAIKSMALPTPVYITMPAPPDIKMSDIVVNTPEVSVQPPDVNVTVEPAVVTVTTPDVVVNVPPTDPPVVTVTSPDVVITPAPITVEAPAVQVDVHAAPLVKTIRTIQRNKKGDITHIVDTPDGE